MAKYSKTLHRIELDFDYKIPHIFMLDGHWVYFGIDHRINGANQLNLITQDFCYKLNNAAPKRGLKA